MHSVEGDILDFNAHLYDRAVTLRFVKRLRGEIKFRSEEALAAQMKQYISDIRGILSDEGFSLEPHRKIPQENVI